MSYEILVGLEIQNDELYTQYREAMLPLLETYGGGFRYDFKVAETLKNEEKRNINRVFTIYAKDEDSMNLFFSDPKYLDIKQNYFEKSVGDTTIISSYNRE